MPSHLNRNVIGQNDGFFLGSYAPVQILLFIVCLQRDFTELPLPLYQNFGIFRWSLGGPECDSKPGLSISKYSADDGQT